MVYRIVGCGKIIIDGFAFRNYRQLVMINIGLFKRSMRQCLPAVSYVIIQGVRSDAANIVDIGFDFGGLNKSVPHAFVRKNRRLGIFAHEKFYGESIGQKVAWRFGTDVLIVFHDFGQVRKPGRSVIILNSYRGALSVIVNGVATALSVGYVFILHDNITVFIQYSFKT